jgi:hypothetical protein
MEKIPNMCVDKLREEIFFDVQIEQLLEDNDYCTKLNATERRDWEAVGKVCRNFLDNELEEKCSLIFQDMIS